MDRVKIGGKTQADLDAEQREEERVRINDEARAYLRETDWYIIRRAEARKPIPEGLSKRRQAARDRVKDIE